MLKAISVSKSHGSEPLFDGVDLVLGPADRIGLVGPNGAGKSTLLHVLAGVMPPDSGQVVRSGRVGLFHQQVPDPTRTVAEYLDADPPEDPDELERWIELRGWVLVDEFRDRLGVAHLPDGARLGEVSGGEQARLALVRVLLAQPDVLLLDEPTNHLDAAGIDWLGRYLAGWAGGLLVVSHDRAFLDRTVSRIVELDGIHDEPQTYEGGYTEYRVEKQRRWERLLRDYEAQEKRRRRWEADIEATKEQARGVEIANPRAPGLRRIARKVARKAIVRERRLRRQMDSVRWIAEPSTRPPLALAFPSASPEPLSLTNATVQHVFKDLDFAVRPGERVRLTGPNGAGKTTLLRCLAGEIEPDEGEVRRPADGLGYLPQVHDDLRTGHSVLDFFRSRVPVYVDEAEELLGAYLFDPEDWAAPLRTLSAGELRRLLLAILVNSPARTLLLDEPTNYLDFESLDVIEEALRAYQGTLVVVTHDEYFARRVGLGRSFSMIDGR